MFCRGGRRREYKDAAVQLSHPPLAAPRPVGGVATAGSTRRMRPFALTRAANASSAAADGADDIPRICRATILGAIPYTVWPSGDVGAAIARSRRVAAQNDLVLECFPPS